MRFHKEFKDISLVGIGSTQFWGYPSSGAGQCFRMAVEECGITLVDTAEYYDDGRCEKRVSEALKGIDRDSYFLVGKVHPANANQQRMERSLKRSLSNLNTDHIDLYLLHWREHTDLQVFVDEAERFVKEGLIRHWGVSNFDTKEMEDLLACKNGERCFCDQILYNVVSRGAEYDLLPYLREHHIMPMAYASTDYRRSGKDRLSRSENIQRICEETGLSIPALMLRFVNRYDDIPALFQTSDPLHLKENLKCFDLDIDQYMDLIDQDFPAPDHKVPLDKI